MVRVDTYVAASVRWPRPIDQVRIAYMF